MRYLASGSTFENIAMVLGDEIGKTLEKHYAELVPNDSQTCKFEKAFENRRRGFANKKRTLRLNRSG